MKEYYISGILKTDMDEVELKKKIEEMFRSIGIEFDLTVEDVSPKRGVDDLEKFFNELDELMESCDDLLD